jgi:hypothetical protein
MKERVTLVIGRKPIILVAPHGCDDFNTDIIAEEMAKQLGCYAVINRGFDRSDVVDVNNDKANCNRVDHAKEDVVYEEFLKPIITFKNQIKKSLSSTSGPRAINNHGWGWNLPDADSSKCVILYVHGAGNAIHRVATEEVGVIVGYGLGTKKDSFTSELWRKNLFIDLYRKYSGDGDAFEGRGGGKYAGRSTNNMNQYFRKHELDPWVDSMQLEIPYSHRKTSSRASSTAALMSLVMKDFLKFNDVGWDADASPKFI